MGNTKYLLESKIFRNLKQIYFFVIIVFIAEFIAQNIFEIAW